MSAKYNERARAGFSEERRCGHDELVDIVFLITALDDEIREVTSNRTVVLLANGSDNYKLLVPLFGDPPHWPRNGVLIRGRRALATHSGTQLSSISVQD